MIPRQTIATSIFRADWKLRSSDDLTLQGDIYSGDADTIVGVFDDVAFSSEFREDNIEMSISTASSCSMVFIFSAN